MRIVSPEEFKISFLKSIQIHESLVFACWHTKRQLTAAMRGTFENIAEMLNLQLYNGDYYTLDAIFYEEKDGANFNAMTSTYAKFISIAIEIENNLSSTHIEMNKLQIINTPLRVLITYCNPDRAQAYLKWYADIIKAADVFDDFSTSRKQLVIFGSLLNDRTSWSFHLYKYKEFLTL